MLMQEMLQNHSSAKRKLKYIQRNYDLYLLLIPALAVLVIFHFVPMWGLQMGFRNYKLTADGQVPWYAITASKWVGLENLTNVIGKKNFLRALRNTLEINVLKIVICFPAACDLRQLPERGRHLHPVPCCFRQLPHCDPCNRRAS